MNPLQIVGLISAVMSAASAAIKLGHDAAPFAEIIYNDIVGKPDLSEADGAAVSAKVAELSARLQAPLPPAQPDDV